MIMRILVAFCIAVFFRITCFAQGADGSHEMGLGKIQLSVVVENNVEQLDESQLSKLRTKIISVASRNGVGGEGYSSPFLLTPTLAIYDEPAVETGMRTVQVVTMEVTLQVKQASNNAVFSTYSRNIKGSGYSKADAVNNAISQINASDPKIKSFIEQGKSKIISFYNSKCSQIIAEADKYAAMNNYEHALAILANVPVEAESCYNQVKDKAVDIFKKYQKQKCESQLQLAEAQIAGNFFISGLRTLSLIDPTSTCFGKAKSLIASTETKLDGHIREEWLKQRELMKDAVELEKMRIEAVRDITVAYYNRKPEVRQNIFMFVN